MEALALGGDPKAVPLAVPMQVYLRRFDHVPVISVISPARFAIGGGKCPFHVRRVLLGWEDQLYR